MKKDFRELRKKYGTFKNYVLDSKVRTATTAYLIGFSLAIILFTPLWWSLLSLVLPGAMFYGMWQNWTGRWI